MKHIFTLLTIINLTILSYSVVYGQSPYSEKDQKLLKDVINIWPYIGIEPTRPTESYMPFDYIHESYKREDPLKSSFDSRLLYELATIELHMNTLIGVNLKNGHFSMPNMYLSLGKSFHFDWMFSATPFVTMTSKFDAAKDLFCLEYSAYVKFDPFYFGFQGSTDGRYYIAMKAVF